jgi:PIN domain nuclease of toxin-antitoxin system
VYLLDTCALLWWTLEPGKLSPRAREACAEIESRGCGLISSITVWEIGVKVRRGQLDIGMSIDEYHRLLREMNTVEIAPVDDLTWLRNLSLEWDHRDPVDRTIVALADLRELPLVTADRAIGAFYPRTCW